MSNSVGQIDLDLEINERGFNNQVNSIGNKAGGMLSGTFFKLGGVIAAAFAVNSLVKFGGSAMTLASNLNEVQNVVDVTFGSMSNQINSFSKTALEKFGLSEYSAKKFTSTMGAMLKSSGLTGQAMTNMSTSIAGLAGDMASFYNLDADEAFMKIRAGISGETEPLKQLGVNMSVANMEAYALSQGITTSYQKMDQASQSLLRYNYLLSVTKDAQGDFARTSGTWANQVRIMSTQWDTFKATMGQGFINMLTPVLAGLNALILKLQVAAQYFSAFTAMLFGSAKAPAGIGAAAKATAAATAGASSSTDKLAGSTSKLGDASKKAAAEIKGSLSGFDQLNVIGKDAADSLDGAGEGGGDAGGGALPPVDLGTPNIDSEGFMAKLQPVKDMLDSLIKPLQAINFQPLISAFGRLKEALAPITATLFAGLHWGYTNILVPLAKWTIEDALPAFLDAVSAALGVLNPILEIFKPLAIWLFNEFLLPIATWTGGIIVDVLNGIADGLNRISAWLVENKDSIILSMGDIIGNISSVGGANTDLVKNFKDAWDDIAKTLLSFVNDTLKPIFKYIVFDFLAPIGKSIIDNILPVLAELFVGITQILGDILKLLKSTFDNALDILKPAMDFIKLVTLDALETMKKLWDKYGKDTIANIREFIQGAQETFQLIWDNIIDPIIKPALEMLTWLWTDHLKGLVEQVGEFVMKCVNGALELYNGFIKPIIDWIVKLFGPSIAAGVTFVVDVFGTMLAGISDVIKGLFKALGGIIDFIVGVFTGDWGKAWRGVKDIFKGIFDSLVGIVKVPLNLIVDAINLVISGLNQISISTPDWLPGDMGGKSFGVSIKPIPKLANGGLVSAPTLAMVGDNMNASIDPEVVSPLSKLQGMIGASNQGMVEVLMMILDAIENLNLSMDIDGERLTQIIRAKLASEDNRVGKPLVTIGGVMA